MPNFDVPTPNNSVHINIDIGSSLVILGANGGGKTRLGVMIEQKLGANSEVHRIAAHRSLTMNTNVQPPSYQIAERRLFYGNDKGDHRHREGSRWQNRAATVLLSDFNHVLEALYADENEVSVSHRQAHLTNPSANPPLTKLDKLKDIWHSVLPHRELLILTGSIQVKPIGVKEEQYDASELSDGERAIFYLIGQILLVRPNTLVIVDEPESHINKSILAKLWDAIESIRNDCAFIYLTHDIEFTISRRAATKYAVHSYSPKENQWIIEAMPENTGLSEEVITKIAGSRVPVLFIEGDNASLDSAIYRRVYVDFTVIPVGSSEHVIHSVASFAKHEVFHRLKCAGLVDADEREGDELKYLASMNVHVLPVSEVENILLLPKPFLAIAKLQLNNDIEADRKLDEFITFVMKDAHSNAENYALRATRRLIDAALKRIGLSSKSITELVNELTTKTTMIDAATIYATILKDFEVVIAKRDYPKILKLYDNKGLLSEAAKILGMKGKRELEEFIGRALQNKSGKELLDALRAELPINA